MACINTRYNGSTSHPNKYCIGDGGRMLLVDLLEYAENDLSMSNKARELSYVVSRAIYDGKKPDHYVEFSGRQEFLIYEPQSVGLDEYPELAVMFTLRKPNTAGSVSAAVCKFTKGGVLLGKYSRGMIFYGLRNMTYDEVKIMVGGTAFHDAFAHEMMHHLDSIRSDDRMPTSKSDNKARYYNNDSEFNAYYHDIVRNLTGAINEIKKGEKPSDIMGLYSLTGDFKTDIAKILKPNGIHEREFLKWLRNSRRKALIKRIYKLYGELTKQVKPILESNTGSQYLYHTTSNSAAYEILESGEIRPKNYESFVSFSLIPLPHGDIEAKDVTLVFNANALRSQLIEVEYTETWYQNHPSQARYVAGEGWVEQFVHEPETFDEDGFDDDGYDEAFASAEIDAFLDKHGEDEWVSINNGAPVRFTKKDVVGMVLHNISTPEDWKTELAALGYDNLTIKFV
jgi:hypothetical protein